MALCIHSLENLPPLFTWILHILIAKCSSAEKKVVFAEADIPAAVPPGLSSESESSNTLRRDMV